MGEETPPRPKQRKGFAVMDVQRIRDIAGIGGKAAHRKGTAHRFSSEEARRAGHLGGWPRGRSRKQSQAS